MVIKKEAIDELVDALLKSPEINTLSEDATELAAWLRGAAVVTDDKPEETINLVVGPRKDDQLGWVSGVLDKDYGEYVQGLDDYQFYAVADYIRQSINWDGERAKELSMCKEVIGDACQKYLSEHGFIKKEVVKQESSNDKALTDKEIAILDYMNGFASSPDGDYTRDTGLSKKELQALDLDAAFIRFPISWSVCDKGEITVPNSIANDLKKRQALFKYIQDREDGIDLGTDPQYLEGSFAIDLENPEDQAMAEEWSDIPSTKEPEQ